MGSGLGGFWGTFWGVGEVLGYPKIPLLQIFLISLVGMKYFL